MNCSDNEMVVAEMVVTHRVHHSCCASDAGGVRQRASLPEQMWAEVVGKER